MFNKSEAPKLKLSVMELLRVSVSGMLGDEDAYHLESGHLTSCFCTSIEAEVYELKSEEFLREVRRQPHCTEL